MSDRVAALVADADARIEAVRAAIAEGDTLRATALMQRAVDEAADDVTRLHLESYAASFLLALARREPGRIEDLNPVLERLRGPVGDALDPGLRTRLELELRVSAAVLARDERALDALVVAAVRLARRHPAAATTAIRATNNRLVVQLERMEGLGIGPGEPAHLDAALAIGQARALADVIGVRGRIDRRSIVAAVMMGDGERAWQWTHEVLEQDLTQSERVALEALGAQLASERGDAAEAVRLGMLAREHARGRSADWTRSHGALGGAIAAASGAGSLTSALRAYRRASGRRGHVTWMPTRALLVGVLALEAGADRAEVEAMVEGCYGERSGWDPHWRALLDATAAPGTWQDGGPVDDWCDGVGAPWERAAALRLRALARMRQGDPARASADVALGLRLVARWPGRRRDALEQLRHQLRPTHVVTPAQGEVLRLLVRGLTDREIADELGRSARTVESHVRALLRAYEVPNRVALAVAAARGSFLA
ncbi:helix-turn-helix transcriptional regulator [Agrococcus terreus]|uniref:LuxR C-terminal-related transcriptional regulator n=1 Tax=Agrococcus terreus TaxID=574649 RepID=UPI003850C232